MSSLLEDCLPDSQIRLRAHHDRITEELEQDAADYSIPILPLDKADPSSFMKSLDYVGECRITVSCIVVGSIEHTFIEPKKLACSGHQALSRLKEIVSGLIATWSHFCPSLASDLANHIFDYNDPRDDAYTPAQLQINVSPEGKYLHRIEFKLGLSDMFEFQFICWIREV